MNPLFRKIASLFFLIIFLIASTPDHLIHALVHHHDTVDCETSATTVGPPHLHCKALQFSLPAFSTTASVSIQYDEPFLVRLFLKADSQDTQFHWLRNSERGPPALA